MYYYSKRNHRKIIHTENCYIAKRFDPETTGTFQTLHEAFSAGYRLCRHCNPIVKQFRKEEEMLYDYCYANGMSFRAGDRYLSVTSTTSKWIITVSAAGQTLLYHKNTKKLNTDALSPIPGYHNQRIMFGTLLEYFEYIKNHDWYRQMHPEKPVKVRNREKEPPRKGTKRWYKEQRKMKNRERRQSIHNVLDIINSFDSSYSVRAIAG